jgi:ankyrin repeat protein
MGGAARGDNGPESAMMLVGAVLTLDLDTGLVKFALTNLQPVNSVLNGVLPLHAAASSGNVAIVQMLIDYGADVNAPR